MKKTKPAQPNASEKNPPKTVDPSTIDLSPEDIDNRSSAKTEVLNEMLERERQAYNLRYWGINE